ncbi:MAG: hypothetical protein M3R02_04170 [Chloroflexota bacterium]|nr:hypothetical protein [Chloroflexota bacterium]
MSNADVNTSNDDDHSPLGPLTDQERDFLAAYRDLDDAGQAWLQWAVRAMVSGHLAPPEEEAIQGWPVPLQFHYRDMVID